MNPKDDMAIQQALSQLGAQGPGPAAPPPGGGMPPAGGGMPPAEGAMPPGPQQAPGELIICPNCGHEFPY